MVQREKAEAKSHPMKKAVRRVQGAPSMIKGGGKKIGRKRGGVWWEQRTGLTLER